MKLYMVKFRSGQFGKVFRFCFLKKSKIISIFVIMMVDDKGINLVILVYKGFCL